MLEDDRARAVRFSTLTAVCDVLGCRPGDVFNVTPVHAPQSARARSDA